jgi:hypothetical protein
MPFSLCNLSTSAFAAMLAYPATISFDLMLRAGPMIGHLVARSVRTEREEKRGEEALDKERRVAVLVLPKKGQALLKRAILSMVGCRKQSLLSAFV